LIIARRLIIFFFATSTTRESLATREPQGEAHISSCPSIGRRRSSCWTSSESCSLPFRRPRSSSCTACNTPCSRPSSRTRSTRTTWCRSTVRRRTRRDFCAKHQTTFSGERAARDARRVSESRVWAGDRAGATTISTNQPSTSRFHEGGCEHPSSAYRTCAPVGGKERNDEV